MQYISKDNAELYQDIDFAITDKIAKIKQSLIR